MSTGILISFLGGLARALPVYRAGDAHGLDLESSEGHPAQA
jgi:hypothetical protein